MAMRLMGGWLMLLLVLVPGACSPSPPPSHLELTLGGEQFLLELATSPAQIEQGLMGRTNIAAGTGMLFLFPQSRVHEFWMGHCLTDIDILFLDGTGRITAAHEMKFQPGQEAGESDIAYRRRMPSYTSTFPARAAIELPPGSLARLGLQAGESTGLNMRTLEEVRAGRAQQMQ